MKAKRKTGRWPKPLRFGEKGEDDAVHFNVTDTGSVGIIIYGMYDERAAYGFLDVDQQVKLIKWLVDASHFIEVNKGRFVQ